MQLSGFRTRLLFTAQKYQPATSFFMLKFNQNGRKFNASLRSLEGLGCQQNLHFSSRCLKYNKIASTKFSICEDPLSNIQVVGGCHINNQQGEEPGKMTSPPHMLRYCQEYRCIDDNLVVTTIPWRHCCCWCQEKIQQKRTFVQNNKKK